MGKNNIDITEIKPSIQEGYTQEKALTKLQTAKRSVIKISDIVAERHVYADKSIIKTTNLIPYPTKAVGLYVEEYIPPHFPSENYLTYVLNVNGAEYKIVPINSQRDGIKIIKCSDVPMDKYYAVYIKEPIQTAYLTIKITTPNDYETPYVSQMKLLLGERVED